MRNSLDHILILSVLCWENSTNSYKALKLYLLMSSISTIYNIQEIIKLSLLRTRLNFLLSFYTKTKFKIKFKQQDTRQNLNLNLV